MYQLFPPISNHPPLVQIAELISDEQRAHQDGRPWVFANMVTTLDGAATAEGVSGNLGGAGDAAVFSALRSQADVIVAGAQTVRTEGYHLPREPAGANARLRAERGQAPRPRLCIVTRQRTIGGYAPLLDELPQHDSPGEPWQRPILATVGASACSAANDDRFDLWELGSDGVDLAALINRLGEQGLTRVLCEGGPSLLGQFASAGLIDEWNFTIDPSIAGGQSVRPAHSPHGLGTKLHLDRMLTDDASVLFTRYLTVR